MKAGVTQRKQGDNGRDKTVTIPTQNALRVQPKLIVHDSQQGHVTTWKTSDSGAKIITGSYPILQDRLPANVHHGVKIIESSNTILDIKQLDPVMTKMEEGEEDKVKYETTANGLTTFTRKDDSDESDQAPYIAFGTFKADKSENIQGSTFKAKDISHEESSYMQETPQPHDFIPALADEVVDVDMSTRNPSIVSPVSTDNSDPAISNNARDSIEQRPAKRRKDRIILDAVVLPTIEEVWRLQRFLSRKSSEVRNKKVNEAEIKREKDADLKSMTPDIFEVEQEFQAQSEAVDHVIDVDAMSDVVLPQEKIEELNQKVRNLKNPKVKKDTSKCLSLDTIRDRLRTIGLDPHPIDLDIDICEISVTRRFISSVYGGSPQRAWSHVSKKKQLSNWHDYDCFMCLNLDLQCHAPERPGHPGLYFDAGAGGVAEELDGVYPLLTRITSDLGGQWQYQGQYVLIPAPGLTKEEWATVDSSVRDNWARELLRSKGGWGYYTLAGTYLRKILGREPTPRELKRSVERKTFVGKVTAGEVGGAFLTGHETVSVWNLKCVGYNEEFQKDVVARRGTWEPPPPKEKKSRAPKAGDKSKPKKQKPKLKQEDVNIGQKRKRKDMTYSDSDSGDEGGFQRQIKVRKQVNRQPQRNTRSVSAEV